MADGLLKKETRFEPLAQGGSILFYLSLALFFFALAGYGGLFLLNRAQREAKQNLVEEARLKEGNLRSDLVNQIFLLDQRLRNLRGLLTSHIFSSNVFKLLEQDTLPQVHFLSFNFNATLRNLDMTGEAVNYATLARQIGIFERDPYIEHVEFGGLSAGANNLAGFKITITLRPNLLQIRP